MAQARPAKKPPAKKAPAKKAPAKSVTARSGPAKKTAKKGAAARLEPGDRAPAFSLPDQDGHNVSLEDFAGSPVVVYFYPADDTPGCTKEACQFNDNLRAFGRAGVAVVGISPDDAASHRAFRVKYRLRLPLLSDPDHDVMQRYGAWGEKTLYGRKTTGVIRSTFLLGGDGKVRQAWYGVRADGHAAKVLEETAAVD
ncbi:MAG TPA: thioredoxin-dependent thiol peroxidase [Acidimicrobiales bacterium]|nr:thioredoxin-dependent thiol peroxidase [Acidimicrobiales bacterium]